MPKISAATIAEHRAQTRDRILDAVAELTRRQGIDEISMTDVAATAGITRTALYNYFPDKAALLLAFTEQVTRIFLSRYREELPEGASAARRLAVFVRLQLEGLLAHPHPGAAELGASLGPDAYQRLAEHVAPMQRLLGGILADGIAAGEFQPADGAGTADTAATARLVLAAIGAQRSPLLRGELDLDAAARPVTSFVLRGLGVPAEELARLDA
ncbi:TetR/AcrR family transcriptional regulator [Allonocardiopsis opalescens]|uniref:TetR family transcriptional regulator n=1 Tax=Allonocardiopsis opalescens TaxID=1144618 RepID=A0A2T0PWI0_9ACTN|nr:TetR/AcrR family transcriptional regulator [Allonocardiopsis opalescens]PRX95718.1 TetR family transcriptional regulator [Allonocardiopsis opalescens]